MSPFLALVAPQFNADSTSLRVKLPFSRATSTIFARSWERASCGAGTDGWGQSWKKPACGLSRRESYCWVRRCQDRTQTASLCRSFTHYAVWVEKLLDFGRGSACRFRSVAHYVESASHSLTSAVCSPNIRISSRIARIRNSARSHHIERYARIAGIGLFRFGQNISERRCLFFS